MIYTGYGRPKKYYNPEEMREKAEEYFKSFSSMGLPFTIGKLCSHLGICRDSLSEYYKDPKFSDTINWMRKECEADQELRLVNKDTFCPGIIFSLKNNHKWVDKTEVDQNVNYPTGINVNFTRPDAAATTTE